MFAAAANAMCANVNSSSITAPTAGDMSSYASFADQVGSRITQLIGQLQALKPPSTDQPAFAQLLVKIRNRASLMNNIQAAAQQGNEQQASVLIAQYNSGFSGDSLAAGLGLDKCAF